jgi:Xaa-Pro aminopeptidase
VLDEPGRWRARGHAAAVVPVDGPSAAIIDVAQLGEREVVADAVRQTADVVADLADALRDGVAPGRVALLGGDALAARWHAALAGQLPDHTLVEDDELATRLRLVKSAAELELVRAAGALGVRAVEASMEAAVARATRCSPASRRCARGSRWERWRGAATRSSPNPPTSERFGEPDTPLGSWGHGIGLAFERPWIEAGADTMMEPGMCLAVERRIEAPGVGGANYEDNLIVTDGGCAVITGARRRWEV